MNIYIYIYYSILYNAFTTSYSVTDSTAPAEAVFAREVKKLQEEQLKPQEQLTLGK